MLFRSQNKKKLHFYLRGILVILHVIFSDANWDSQFHFAYHLMLRWSWGRYLLKVGSSLDISLVRVDCLGLGRHYTLCIVLHV